MDKRYQVFVSSTFTDLETERQHATWALQAMNCIPAGMELFPASSDDQWTVIKRVIDECDYYLLILAGRYGSLDKDGVGYTEKEFDYAVSQGKPIISFLHKNPDSLPFNKSEQDPKRRKKLEDFRKKAASDKVVQFWTSPEDIAAKVSPSLYSLFRTHPAEGWVRGRFAGDSEELLRLRSRVEELEGQLSKALSDQAKSTPSLPSEAITFLKDAAGSKLGQILATRSLEGLTIQAGEFVFKEKGDKRKAAFYENSLATLQQAGLIDVVKDGLYRVNHSGYEYVEGLQDTGTANQSKVTLNVGGWGLRYLGSSPIGSPTEVQPESASSVQYWFNLNAFNDWEKGEVRP